MCTVWTQPCAAMPTWARKRSNRVKTQPKWNAPMAELEDAPASEAGDESHESSRLSWGTNQYWVSSSIGRTPVSKTGGCRFETCDARHRVALPASFMRSGSHHMRRSPSWTKAPDFDSGNRSFESTTACQFTTRNSGRSAVGSAVALGASGRRFDFCRPDHTRARPGDSHRPLVETGLKNWEAPELVTGHHWSIGREVQGSGLPSRRRASGSFVRIEHAQKPGVRLPYGSPSPQRSTRLVSGDIIHSFFFPR